MSVSLFLWLSFIGDISFDIDNRTLNRLFLIDPELMLRSKMRVKLWVPEFRGVQLCRPHNLLLWISPWGLQDYSWGSWAARPASLRKLPQRDDKAPPPSFLLSLEAGNTDLPEPRTVLLQEKALGLHLVNIIPGGKLSHFPTFKLLQFSPQHFLRASAWEQRHLYKSTGTC